MKNNLLGSETERTFQSLFSKPKPNFRIQDITGKVFKKKETEEPLVSWFQESKGLSNLIQQQRSGLSSVQSTRGNQVLVLNTPRLNKDTHRRSAKALRKIKKRDIFMNFCLATINLERAETPTIHNYASRVVTSRRIHASQEKLKEVKTISNIL